jgi:hypothetical protein
MVVWALRQLFNDASFAGWLFEFYRLLLILLQKCFLEF